MKSLRKKNFQTLEHEEVYQKIQQNTSHMDDLQKNIEKQLQAFIAMNQNTTNISESLKKYSVDSSNFNSKIPLADCLQRSSEWQNSIGDIFKHLGNLLYDRTTQPLKETIRIQTDIVKDSKKKLKGFGANSVGGSSSTNVNNRTDSNSIGGSGGTIRGTSEKKDQIEYDKISKEALQLFRDSELALETTAIQSILSSFESYYDFFQKGAFQMNKIKIEIENYKKIVLETNKAAAKLRNYIPRKTFGVRLEEVFARESNKSIPQFLEDIFKYLERMAPQNEGVFRVSAGKSAIDALQKKIEDGSQVLDLDSIHDVHVVTCVLKSFFRNLPEPLINHNLYKNYLHLTSATNRSDSKLVISELKRLISSLKVCNQVVLKHVLQICGLVNLNKEITKMDLNNLAVVIGPNLLEPLPNLKAEDIQKAETFAEFYGLFMLLVEHCQAIFPQVSQTEFGRLRSATEPAISPIKQPLTPITSPVTSPTQVQLSSGSLPSSPFNNPLGTSDFVMINNSDSKSSSNLQQQISSGSSSSSNSSVSTPTLSSPSLSNQNKGGSSTTSLQGVTSSPKPPTSTQKKLRNDADLLKPIDVQISFINATSNLGKLKSKLDSITTVQEGILLIKIFKKLGDEHITPLQKQLGYQYQKEKPNYDNQPTEDKIVKIQRTLSFAYDVAIDTLIAANNMFEAATDLDQEPNEQTDIISKSFQTINNFVQNECQSILSTPPSEIVSSTSSLPPI